MNLTSSHFGVVLWKRPYIAQLHMNTTIPQTASLDPVEARKERLNLRPALAFVHERLPLYELGYQQLLAAPTTVRGANRLHCITHPSAENLQEGVQLSPAEFAVLFRSMPSSVLCLSRLSKVSYRFAHSVVVPQFDSDGSLLGADAVVRLGQFPRQGDHPERILIGCTSADGTEILVTALPLCIMASDRARWFYQLDVMLHEIFHTIELPLRGSDERDDIRLRWKESSFTFGEWWRDWQCLFLNRSEPEPVTRYAATYADSLTPEVKDADPKKFEQALAEQICESFAAYMLGIAPNDAGWTNFETEPFGNKEMELAFRRGEVPVPSMKAFLMKQFCEARVL